MARKQLHKLIDLILDVNGIKKQVGFTMHEHGTIYVCIQDNGVIKNSYTLYVSDSEENRNRVYNECIKQLEILKKESQRAATLKDSIKNDKDSTNK